MVGSFGPCVLIIQLAVVLVPSTQAQLATGLADRADTDRVEAPAARSWRGRTIARAADTVSM